MVASRHRLRKGCVMALPHAEGYTNTAAGITSFVYGNMSYAAMNANRLALLRMMFPDLKSHRTLPKNPGLVQWTDGIAVYRVLPFNFNPEENKQSQGKARFQVLCPECSGQRWFSVGKFMLHAPVHKKEA